jgi:hypothetical protein
MKSLFAALALLVAAQSVQAQSKGDYKPLNQTADLALASNGDFTTVALSYNRLHGLGKSHRFRVGYGVRFTSAFGSNIDHRTAPARLTSGQASFAALFAEDIIANIDTVRFKSVQVNSLNVSIHLEYGITPRLDVGFNIDGLGFSFGGEQSGVFQANQPTRSPLSGTTQTAKPTGFNLLLVSDSDLGSLNSEIYARYRLNDKISLRGGLGFQFSEYTTTRKLTFDNDRFRAKNLMPALAVAYHF